MEKGFYYVELTKVLYRVTELFPEKEPLRFLIREKADKILADLILVFPENPVVLSNKEKSKALERILNNLEILWAYFEVAERQGWVKSQNYAVLKREYSKVKTEIEQKSAVLAAAAVKEKKENGSAVKERKVPKPVAPKELKERHKKILRILQQKEKAQVNDLKRAFPKVTIRTLRRDMGYLVGLKLVERRGYRNTIHYVLK